MSLTTRLQLTESLSNQIINSNDLNEACFSDRDVAGGCSRGEAPLG